MFLRWGMREQRSAVAINRGGNQIRDGPLSDRRRFREFADEFVPQSPGVVTVQAPRPGRQSGRQHMPQEGLEALDDLPAGELIAVLVLPTPGALRQIRTIGRQFVLSYDGALFFNDVGSHATDHRPESLSHFLDIHQRCPIGRRASLGYGQIALLGLILAFCGRWFTSTKN